MTEERGRWHQSEEDAQELVSPDGRSNYWWKRLDEINIREALLQDAVKALEGILTAPTCDDTKLTPELSAAIDHAEAIIQRWGKL